MEDPDAWKYKIADPHWKQGKADAQKRYETEIAAWEAQTAIKKKEQQRLASLARMRWLLGAS